MRSRLGVRMGAAVAAEVAVAEVVAEDHDDVGRGGGGAGGRRRPGPDEAKKSRRFMVSPFQFGLSSVASYVTIQFARKPVKTGPGGTFYAAVIPHCRAGRGPLPGGSGAVKVEKISYKGWPNCYRVSNGEVELVVTGDIGPRIMRYGFVGGQNLFKEFAEQMGKTRRGEVPAPRRAPGLGGARGPRRHLGAGQRAGEDRR